MFFLTSKVGWSVFKEEKKGEKKVYKIQFHAQKTQLLKDYLVNMGKKYI